VTRSERIVAERIGLFGGAFDPIHVAHLIIAEQAREQLGLDRVWFTPAAIPPHKRTVELTPGRCRLEMIELATAGHESFEASAIEINRGGISYTVDTLRALKEARPDDDFHLILGSDSLRDFPLWLAPAEILRMSKLAVARRPGANELEVADVERRLDLGARGRLVAHVIDVPLMEISSSDIRARIASGRSIRYMVPAAVEAYIRHHRLYVEAIEGAP
jgi:nicotinate-nucleotide adenylyltransferase